MNRKTLRAAILGITPAIAAAQGTDLVIYVDEGASGTNNGTSWTDAYNDLQDGIDDAESTSGLFGRRVVLVAEGKYNPTTATWPIGSTDLRDRSFVIDGLESIEVRGGFLGGPTGTTAIDAPDGAFNKTILSGAIPGFGQVRHVLAHDANQVTNTIIHGLVIEDGLATGPDPTIDREGAGVYLVGSSDILFERVTIRNNEARARGGGIFLLKGNGTLNMKNCVVRENFARDGAGIYYQSGLRVNLANVTVRDNGRTIAELGGTGISTERGGGLLMEFDSRIDAANCLIFDNAALIAGGGVYYDPYNSGPTGVYNHVWKHCTVAYNRIGALNSSPPSNNGAGFHIEPGFHDGEERVQTCDIFNSIIYNNRVGRDMTMLGDSTDTGIVTTVEYSDVGTDFTTTVAMDRYTETNTIDLDPRFINPATRNLRLRIDLLGPNTSPCIDNGKDAERGPDVLDLDDDAATTLLPLDRANENRIVNISFITGSLPGAGSIDMGAFEAREPDAPSQGM
ncbi:MAG: right-handed parallel beta-helix repeat-containing protein [Acidobacteriota bacterium]